MRPSLFRRADPSPIRLASDVASRPCVVRLGIDSAVFLPGFSRPGGSIPCARPVVSVAGPSGPADAHARAPAANPYFFAAATFFALLLYRRVDGRTITIPSLGPGTGPLTSSRFLSG